MNVRRSILLAPTISQSSGKGTVDKRQYLLLTVIIAICFSIPACSDNTEEIAEEFVKKVEIPFVSVTTREYSVYSDLIEAWFSPKPGTSNPERYELFVIADHTATGGLSDTPSGDCNLQYIWKEMPGISPETFDDFIAKNQKEYPLERLFHLKEYYILYGKEESEEIIPDPESTFWDWDTGNWWGKFYEKYPNSQGVTSLSRVGFNYEMDQALVYIETRSHFLAESGYYVLLETANRARRVWIIKDKVMAWIS